MVSVLLEKILVVHIQKLHIKGYAVVCVTSSRPIDSIVYIYDDLNILVRKTKDGLNKGLLDL